MNEEVSTNDAPFVHGVDSASLLLLLEAVPEAQSLITSTSDDGLAIWAHSKVQDTVGVSGERNDLLHVGVLPDHDLVLAVAMRGHNLVAVLGPS